MADALAERVRRRASACCEYCLLPKAYCVLPFELEHILPKQHGGLREFGNLAFACLHCNRHKGPNLTGIDRIGGRRKLMSLFNPRRQLWSRHFRLDGPRLTGRTPVGRATIAVLNMNDSLMVELRQELIAEGRYPPQRRNQPSA